MPPRPTGVDGKDHNYRMVIEERYQRLSEFKGSINRLLGTSVLCCLLRTAWQAICLLDGYSLPTITLFSLVAEAVVVLLYFRTKIGTAKESLIMLKVFNSVQAIATGTVALSSFHYHMGVANQGVSTNIYPEIWRKLAKEGRLGKTDPEAIFQTAQGLELFIDLTTCCFMVLSTMVAHRYIVLRMDIKKVAAAAGGRAEGGSAAAAAGGGARIKAEDSEDEQEERETKVVKAAASSRTRERRKAA